MKRLEQYFTERCNKKFSALEIATVLKMNRATISDNLTRLYDLGIIDRAGERKDGFTYWKKEAHPLDEEIRKALANTVFRNFLPLSAIKLGVA